VAVAVAVAAVLEMVHTKPPEAAAVLAVDRADGVLTQTVELAALPALVGQMQLTVLTVLRAVVVDVLCPVQVVRAVLVIQAVVLQEDAVVALAVVVGVLLGLQLALLEVRAVVQVLLGLLLLYMGHPLFTL
jgi:hypothetical protein